MRGQPVWLAAVTIRYKTCDAALSGFEYRVLAISRGSIDPDVSERLGIGWDIGRSSGDIIRAEQVRHEIGVLGPRQRRRFIGWHRGADPLVERGERLAVPLIEKGVANERRRIRRLSPQVGAMASRTRSQVHDRSALGLTGRVHASPDRATDARTILRNHGTSSDGNRGTQSRTDDESNSSL
jgi:hypothetical protein